MILLTLFLEFFKTGLFAVGGGLATIPFLYSMSDKYGWFTRAELGNMIAVSESTPGPIGINMATYAGIEVSGVLGALAATVGLVFPSVVIIILISKILDKFKENTLTENIFYGIRPVVAGLVASAGAGMIEIALFDAEISAGILNFLQSVDIKAVVMFAVLLFLTNKFKLHPIFYIILSGAAGAVFAM